MNKKDEALKLALSALERTVDKMTDGQRYTDEGQALLDALFDLREALAEQQPAQQEPVAWANPNDLQNFDMKVRTNGGPLHTVPLYTAPQSAQQQEPVAFGEVLRGRVCGYTPGMSRVELQLPESTLIGGWLELGETVYIASVLGFNQHTIEAKLKEKNT